MVRELPAHRFAQKYPPAPSLLWWKDERLEIFFAPLDEINEKARIGLVGITPGLQQMVSALREFRACLDSGRSVSEASFAAKRAAEFRGMRTSISKMLDYLGLQNWLGIRSCSEIFDVRRDLLHTTSAIRYPTFLSGKNYNGSGVMALDHPQLRYLVDTCLKDEIEALPNAIWIPLGPKVAEIFDYLVRRGALKDEFVLSGMPHPSGANNERIAYFLGKKREKDLSAKTNAEAIDSARSALKTKIAALV
jgi:hypothetical protein